MLSLMEGEDSNNGITPACGLPEVCFTCHWWQQYRAQSGSLYSYVFMIGQQSQLYLGGAVQRHIEATTCSCTGNWMLFRNESNHAYSLLQQHHVGAASERYSYTNKHTSALFSLWVMLWPVQLHIPCQYMFHLWYWLWSFHCSCGGLSWAGNGMHVCKGGRVNAAQGILHVWTQYIHEQSSNIYQRMYCWRWSVVISWVRLVLLRSSAAWNELSSQPSCMSLCSSRFWVHECEMLFSEPPIYMHSVERN